MVEQQTAVHAFVEALSRRDFTRMRDCLAPGVVFRALIPAGFREATGPDPTLEYFREWFEGRDDFKMSESDVHVIADRVQAGYRVMATHEGRPYVLEEHLCCGIQGDGIASIDLLCSGFRQA